MLGSVHIQQWMLSKSLQMHSRTRLHAFADASSFVTFMDASANARNARRHIHGHIYMHSGMHVDASVNAHGRVCRRVHGHCVCCAYDRFLSLSPTPWRTLGGKGEQVALTLVRRTSSGPVRQLILPVHATATTEPLLSSDLHVELRSDL